MSLVHASNELVPTVIQKYCLQQHPLIQVFLLEQPSAENTHPADRENYLHTPGIVPELLRRHKHLNSYGAV